ncbi:hypothetical protein L484_025166 [Morus notabilis]|uniref:(S)-ureidoglycine aminohydrolase cupin domain-containing protein n=1 Tax=Morus notabilis TaxID=981085 RepID=W9RZP3_9ROSA|nr:uncharacterized protein LOC21407875 [Morus notabilis]EXB80310.1 hypothetical protein L484_025166 [Morus notabilis]
MACIGVVGGGLVSGNTRTRSYCSLSSGNSTSRRVGTAVVIRADSMATEKLGIKIEKNPPESKLAQLGVRNWPKWGCPPSKFPWTYDAKETCYLLEGKVKVTPAGSTESVEIGAGDLVEFPKGMNCTWDVSAAVDKHYNFS